MTDKERIDALEKQCHFFHTELERYGHLSGRLQAHELRLYNLENYPRDATRIDSNGQRHR